MITYPNQKIVTVLKPQCEKDFLQIPNGTWQYAAKVLTYSAFKLFLYFASNKNGYSFALSYEDVNEAIPMNRKTYDKAVKELKDAGFLYQVRGNNWTFNCE